MNGKGILLLFAIVGATSLIAYYLGYHAGFSARDPEALKNLTPIANDIFEQYQRALEYNASN